MEDVLIIAISWLFSAVVGGLVAYFMVGARLSEVLYEIGNAKRMYAGAMGSAGVNARQQQNEEMEAALGEAVLIMQNPEIPDKPKALMGLATKYPNIAMKLLKKYGLKL